MCNTPGRIELSQTGLARWGPVRGAAPLTFHEGRRGAGLARLAAARRCGRISRIPTTAGMEDPTSMKLDLHRRPVLALLTAGTPWSQCWRLLHRPPLRVPTAEHTL
jgi:hypothetical protein